MKAPDTRQPVQAAATPKSSVAQWLEKCWNRGWLFALVLVAATLIAYQSVSHAGFIWDDGSLLLHNDLVKQPDGWWRCWLSKGIDYVPATSTTFWLEWRLWGTHPQGYHLDNVILHGLSAGLIWRILRRLKVTGARLAAALFALHPVNVASVAWIAERKDTLAMAFYACSLLWYLKFEDTGRLRWYWLAAGAFVLAIFSKTAVAPLPLVLLGMAWWQRGRIEWRDVKRSLLFVALAAGASVLALWVQHEASAPMVRAADFWSRLGVAGWAVWFYLGKALLPLNLIPVYPLWHFHEARLVCYLPALAVLTVLAVSWHYRNRGGRALLAGFGYFVLLLLPVLGFVNIAMMRYTLVADQWQYFAIIGPIALVAAGITLAMQYSGKVRIVLQAVVCATLLVSLDLLTWRQCFAYAEPATLWQATVEANPDSFLAHSSLGGILFRKGKAAEAKAQYERALEIEPNFTDAHYDLGNIFLQTGHPAEAIGHYQKVMEVQPDFLPAINNLAWVLATCPQASIRDGAAAVEYARRANQLSGGKNANIISTLAAAYAEAGQFPEALRAARQALSLAINHKDTAAVDELRRQLGFYQKGLPYRDPLQPGAAAGAPLRAD
ncbi:MAG: tetratricopeptide repeat protein [Verrucomicrobiota bacterium]